MRKILLPAVLALSAIAILARTVRAHEDKTDPVCGMRVDPDQVPWKADYAGETYYFCMQADRDTFLGDPERYAGALTLTSAREKHELVMVVRPRVPTAGSTVKLFVRGFEVGDRMASPPKPPKPLSDPVAVVYEMDRTSLPEGERYRLAPIKSGDEDNDEAVYGLARLATTAGSWRVVIDADLDGGRRRGIFTIPIAPVGTATQTLADEHAAHANMPDMPGMSDLSMAAQHETMKTIGQHWYALGEWLRGGSGTRDEAGAHLGEVERAAKNVPLFMLHKFPESTSEFRGYAEEFVRELPKMREALKSNDRSPANEIFRQIDAQNCTKCHLKFRWAAADDLSHFPDLRVFPEKGK